MRQFSSLFYTLGVGYLSFNYVNVSFYPFVWQPFSWVFELRSPFPFSVMFSMILKMRICLYSATPWDSENLPFSQPRHLRQRTLIQPLCRLGNGFLPVTYDRFRGFKAKRTNRKTFENEPVKPLETHEYPLPSQQSHAAMTSSWRATYRQTREIGHGIFHIMRAMDLVGSSCARGSRFNQSEESICWPIRAEYMLTNQSEGARDSTNQSLPPGMQRAVPLTV